ncbi:MAG: hypothetical protein M0R00_02225, partial [Candidatus Omnitrophica bacterium]|nr:hypothetical protein [Candidatus Omnitrophota bacterium]
MFKSFRLKWLILFFFFVSSLLIGLKTTREFFFFFAYFLFSVTLISLAWLVFTYLTARLQFSREMISRVTEGERLEVALTVRNTGIFPAFNLVIEDYFSFKRPERERKSFFLDFLGIKGSAKIEYDYLCSRRGEYKVGPFAVYFFDPLNLFFFKRTYNIYSEVIVYPQ